MASFSIPSLPTRSHLFPLHTSIHHHLYSYHSACHTNNIACRVAPNEIQGNRQLRNSDGSDTVFGFQVNERYLDWDESAARQLIRIWVAEQMNCDVEYVNEKLAELSVLLPDMVNRLDKLQAQLVLQLVQNVDNVAHRMISLTDALGPGVNVSQMVSGNVWLLAQPPASELKQKIEKMRDSLPGVDVEALVSDEPRLLLADIEGVKEELCRLMPATDPVKLVATHAGMVLSMKDAGLVASLVIDDGIAAD